MTVTGQGDNPTFTLKSSIHLVQIQGMESHVLFFVANRLSSGSQLQGQQLQSASAQRRGEGMDGWMWEKTNQNTLVETGFATSRVMENHLLRDFLKKWAFCRVGNIMTSVKVPFWGEKIIPFRAEHDDNPLFLFVNVKGVIHDKPWEMISIFFQNEFSDMNDTEMCDFSCCGTTEPYGSTTGLQPRKDHLCMGEKNEVTTWRTGGPLVYYKWVFPKCLKKSTTTLSVDHWASGYEKCKFQTTWCLLEAKSSLLKIWLGVLYWFNFV